MDFGFFLRRGAREDLGEGEGTLFTSSGDVGGGGRVCGCGRGDFVRVVVFVILALGALSSSASSVSSLSSLSSSLAHAMWTTE